jgi:DNA (cytosine-5)-methyltransferase 1
MGYHHAGFDQIVGVDNRPQPRYPFEFVHAHALEYVAEHGREFDAIHASPPCQAFTSMNTMWNAREHADLLTPCRELLIETGQPYVIENVPGAPMADYITLCGSMFGLQSEDAELRRHRWFEINPPMMLLRSPCAHNQMPRTNTVLGHGGKGRTPVTIGVYGQAGGGNYSTRDNTRGFTTKERQQAMGIDWMKGDELSQAIPPAYTEYIGHELIKHLGFAA